MQVCKHLFLGLMGFVLAIHSMAQTDTLKPVRIAVFAPVYLDSVFTNAIPNSFYPDNNQNLWLGTEQGLIRFFTNGFQNFDTKNLNGIWSMVEDRKGNMWFGEYDSEKLTHFTNGRLKEMKINYPIYPTFKKQISDFGKFYFGGGHDNKGNIYFPMVWGVMKYDGYKFSPFSLGKRKE